MRIDEVLAHIPRGADLQAAVQASGAPAWIVGGSLRDLLRGDTPADIDLATPASETLARSLAELTGGSLVPLDLERGIWRVAVRDAPYFDCCQLRAADIASDLQGRDFTFNALALRVTDDGAGGLFDPFHGLDDLHSGLLRMVSPQTFTDDPARIMRAFRFCAEHHVTIEANTWQALCATVTCLPRVAAERILAEWWKLCAGPFAAAAITRMDAAGVLGLLLPEVEATRGVTQNLYHHLDVWEHALLATTVMHKMLRAPEEAFGVLTPAFQPLCMDAHRAARLVYLALIHDIGKPDTRTVEGDRVHFYGHEMRGAELATQIARRLRMSRADLHASACIIRHHLRPLFLLTAQRRNELSPRAMLRFFVQTGEYALEVMALAMADKAAACGPAADADIREQLHLLYGRLLAFYATRYRPALELPFLTGHDLIQELRLPPGPNIGRLLHQARELQILGKLTSRAEALHWAATRGRGE